MTTLLTSYDFAVGYGSKLSLFNYIPTINIMLNYNTSLQVLNLVHHM